jgi:hypothetical protein
VHSAVLALLGVPRFGSLNGLLRSCMLTFSRCADPAKRARHEQQQNGKTQWRSARQGESYEESKEG